jgi:uncharacterized protein (DUF3820 family)
MQNNKISDKEYLIKLANTKMPFGKYKGQFLADIPEPYYVWFAKQGFPKGELGEMLQLMNEIKINGLEYLIKNIRKM